MWCVTACCLCNRRRGLRRGRGLRPQQQRRSASGNHIRQDPFPSCCWGRRSWYGFFQRVCSCGGHCDLLASITARRIDGNNSTAAIFRQYGNYFADFWIFLRRKVDAHLTFGGILELKKFVTRPLYLQYTYEATFCYYSYNRKWFGLILPSRITGSSTAHC